MYDIPSFLLVLTLLLWLCLCICFLNVCRSTFYASDKKRRKKNEVGTALVQNDLEVVFPLIRRENWKRRGEARISRALEWKNTFQLLWTSPIFFSEVFFVELRRLSVSLYFLSYAINFSFLTFSLSSWFLPMFLKRLCHKIRMFRKWFQ
jgi:hypothetical protein